MASEHTAWRLEFASQIAARISVFNGVRAIAVGGSVARGYADAHSDLEMYIFWDHLPDDTVRHSVITAVRGELFIGYDGPSKEDQLLINSFQVDLLHNTVAEEETVIERVLHAHSTSLSDSNFMDTLRYCIPLFGDKLLQGWKLLAQEYPLDLAERNIVENLDRLHLNRPVVSAKRGNTIMLYADNVQLQQTVFLILLAVNRMYFPTYKWIQQSLKIMTVKPPQIGERFERMYALPYEQAVEELRRLMDETLSLVEGQFPAMDTEAARKRISYVRTPHEAAVIFDG